LITRPGCERIIRYAFEYAVQYQRKRVTCFVKDNIMKMTDGLFHEVFKEIGQEYPQLEQDAMIVDIGAARVADTPEQFDVIVMPNLYGDIISDIAAQIAGSVGLAGSANIGNSCAMFEAIHGSAPDLAGLDKANPSGLLHGAIQMLVHIGQVDVATTIHNAWLSTIEKGLHTQDIYREGQSLKCIGTQAFPDAVIAHLGEQPKTLSVANYHHAKKLDLPPVQRHAPSHKKLVGVDVFLQWQGSTPNLLGEQLASLEHNSLGLQVITNRGVKVWPHGFPETFCVDHWRCRFVAQDGRRVTFDDLLTLQRVIHSAQLAIIKTENLYDFDGQPGYAGVHG
jgi:isocitrate dehydrogenase